MSYIGTTKIGGMYLGSTEIAKAYLGSSLVYQKAGEPVPDHACVTFTSSSTNTLSMTCNGTAAPVLYYSTNGTTWTQWNYSALTISAGHPVFMYGNNPSSFSSSADNYAQFSIGGTGKVSCTGDLTTFIDGTGNVATIPSSYYFYRLFYQCAKLLGTPDLPSTTMKNWCYSEMFGRCSAITTAPSLPATTLASRCYRSMFNRCSALVNVPTTLPATTLATYCYNYMFYSCGNLVTAPVLPAVTLVDQCYSQMFNGCSKLNYIKAMFTTTPTTGRTASWVSGVAATGTFVKNSAATWNVVGVYGVPSGWTIETASS